MQDPVNSCSFSLADPAGGSGFVRAPLRMGLSEGIDDRDLVSFASRHQLRIGLAIFGGVEIACDDERDPLSHESLRAFTDQAG